MKTLLKKLTSRKFLAAVAGFVAGMAIVFGADENTIATVTGAVTSAASVVSYVLAEGMVDKAAVKKE